MMVPFPMGEKVNIPASGGYSWPYYSQLHNGGGGTVTQVRGGQWQLGPCCTKDPLINNRPIVDADEAFSGSIPIPSNEVTDWRNAAPGKYENRFTTDTNSKFNGDRQYMSGAFNAYLNMLGAPVGYTGRGWYRGIEYTNFSFKDSSIGSGTGFRASTLASTCAPEPSATFTYSLAEGATHAFAYLNANLHAGSKGTVLFENRTGDTGTITVNTGALTAGNKVLLGGAWEKGVDGWGAGAARLPFKVC
jgi:hypothetical protein